MAIKSSLSVSQEEIEAITAALAEEPLAHDSDIILEETERHIRQGWTEKSDLIALLTAHDYRLRAVFMTMEDSFLSRLGLNDETRFQVATLAEEDPAPGAPSTNLAEAACLSIWLQRLGFDTDPRQLCRAVGSATEDVNYMTGDERIALLYDRGTATPPSMSISVEPRRAVLDEKEVFVTPAGDRIRSGYDEHGTLTTIRSLAPGYHDPDDE